MKGNLRYLFISILLIIVFILGKQCTNANKTDLKPIRDTLVFNTVDTIRDTVKVFKMAEKVIFKPVEILRYVDTNKYKEIPKYRVYKDTIRDSNIVLYSTDTVLGYLTSKSINYRLLVPLKIYDSTKVVIRSRPKYMLNVGIIYNNTLYPVVEFNHNRISYSIGYNKNLLVGVKYTLWYK